jgi:hypothetical protein
MTREEVKELLTERGPLTVYTVDAGPFFVDDHAALDGVVGEIDGVTDRYHPRVEALDERRVIKRRYSHHGPIAINDSAPIRNEVIEFVGNRFVTPDELTSFFSKLEEDKGGKAKNYRKWFARNGRYFESATVKGKKILMLSKLGRRVFEHIVKRRSVNEAMGFESFLLEQELVASMKQDDVD